MGAGLHIHFIWCHSLVPGGTTYVTFPTGPMQCLLPHSFTNCHINCVALHLPHITQPMAPSVVSVILVCLSHVVCHGENLSVIKYFSVIQNLREPCHSYT